MPADLTLNTPAVLNAADGTALSFTDFMVDDTAGRCGGIVLMHGLGEHGGRYRHVARFFNDCGWSVRIYDHRGHGRSGGPRGDVPHQDTLLQDAEIVIGDFAHQLGAPPLLFGHSMGGLFAARLALAAKMPLAGLILSSPALALPLSRGQLLLLKILSAIAPGLAVPNGLKTQFLSHDPAVAVAYHSDRLVHGRISARLLHSMRAAVADCQAQAATLAIPVLMVVAGDDRLVDAQGSHLFFRQLPQELRKMHCYDRFYHEIFNEIDAQRVFADVRAWLDVDRRIA
ncbi:alpha/beta hydrolase [Undibacterium arcticum]|uniref:Alpha/beta hydrolase n=1 Tax=Undibacterium arcticum TaxID=1762892 RepID=A0ABV7F584_9BURK